ncbi:uncharacterized protein BKA55DRAFT_694048 [Fusarium redolens]|uniref:SMP domain-containing protein n=1 Tax=Fusarium redolens TaxID=48865 RepID=A0A9P9GFF4_FUSRE|nr:uncharacterized protein BKA55DRAFT_694048 [Fusarium redolens]KAH7237560.1 hypothetical protein BKA55DRAFT_694048 [Fusarium redolens]
MPGDEKVIIPMTKEAAARIQAGAANDGNDPDFAVRAQAAGDKNINEAAKEAKEQGEQKK